MASETSAIYTSLIKLKFWERFQLLEWIKHAYPEE